MTNQASKMNGRRGHFSESFSILTFRTNEQLYALPITAVCQLIEMVAINPIPEAPPAIQGVINVHGEIVPVIDLRLRLGLPFKSYQLRTPIILLQANGRSLALVVDEVETVIELSRADVQTQENVLGHATAENQNQKSYFSSIAKVDKQLIIIIDEAELIDSHMQANLAQRIAKPVAEAATKNEWVGA